MFYRKQFLIFCRSK